jgi:hypothetical protein
LALYDYAAGFSINGPGLSVLRNRHANARLSSSRRVPEISITRHRTPVKTSREWFSRSRGKACRLSGGSSPGRRNGVVNASDVSQAKLQSGQPVSSSNFRNDVTVNGSINASDVSSVKSKSGTALP